jgi:hypothetical protein
MKEGRDIGAIGIPGEIKDEDKEKQDHVIELPDDLDPGRRASLEAKLEEYRERLKQRMEANRYQPPEFFASTRYKITVLETLLTDGRVDTHDLYQKIKGEDGSVDLEAFNNACGVIDDYATTGGKGVRNASRPLEQKPPAR